MSAASSAPDADAIAVGAGAAGLLAAIRAAERGRRVVLLEKNRRPGVKILISGGTRCNVTHDCGPRGIEEAFGAGGAFLRASLAAFPPAAIRSLLEDEGVPLYVEPENGKVFPKSDRAQDVLAALMKRFHRSGARLELNAPATGLEREGDGFVVRSGGRAWRAPRVVLTTGGTSFPKVGTTGDGYAFARAFGHSIVPPRPALVPLACADQAIRALAGIDLQDAEIRVLDGMTVLARRRAPILFTHFGISGPSAMDVSRVVDRPLGAEIDLLPAEAAAALHAWLRAETESGGRRHIATVVGLKVASRLATAALAAAGVPPTRKLSELSRSERAATVKALKGLPAKITGTLGFDKAEVTAGGVTLAEVDPRTMESRFTAGLHLAGEILDLDGWIGGYNFQAAFSTGWAAGSAV